MPNTLAHLGLQAVATRTFIRHADPKWIFAGCILPDVPWILQRAVKTLAPAVDPYALRLYCIVQSSLAGCLLLCAALAFFAARPRQIFAVLAVNSFLHLLLDAFQTKFANGVHLFAPFSWELLNFGLFWPESWITYVLTIFGLAYVIWCRKGRQAGSTGFSLAHRGRLVLGGVLVVAYLVLPFAFLSGPFAADNHSVKTLQEREARPGRSVEFDRSHYVHRVKRPDILRIFTGEELIVYASRQHASSSVSAKAKFLDEHTIVILDIHRHAPWVRDVASYIGLLLVAALWLEWLGKTILAQRVSTLAGKLQSNRPQG